MKHKQKLYLVKREVMASSIKQATEKRGIIYAVELGEDKYQPEDERPIRGFKPKKI